ncbi:PLD nuclease N-terminal domain-containing protein [Actinacidiphila sp. ITFR-21]|uniref:PLD nuclease N-terminal domain-containing protein n=1 Tax=Actinacidiphila sp. ITFR-21 TaxID=3075199 RepID=UPI00288B31CE|nr:PLD nuclease N-terminal domain-containing protein [Streptomyces sp. ITFR-21]WNI17160.1 PLD nuclease N-terminal domain-containing protein [Streptomyces sp. ITFR-21]
MMHYLPYVLLITLWIYAFVDCLGTPEQEVRGLPKVLWVLVILFFGEILVGPLAWLMVGKRRTAASYPRSAYGQAGRSGPRTEPVRDRSEPEQPERGRTFVAPDDNPEFLRSLSELIRQKREDGTSPSDGE